MNPYIHYWNGDSHKRFNFPKFETIIYEKWHIFTRINPYSIKYIVYNPLYSVRWPKRAILWSTKNLAKLMKE